VKGKKAKVVELKEALEKCGIRDGFTLSFHHQLRNGDNVINITLEAVRELGIKNIRLAQTAIFDVHKPVIEHIEEGTIKSIEGSINGVVGDYISKNPLEKPVVLRSHGRRWGDVRNGTLHIDIAVIAASASDEMGNCTGIIGKNPFGPIAYSQMDAMMADKVIVVTDTLEEYPCPYQEITENYVDYVAVVDNIGDPKRIAWGTTKITTDPVKQKIAHNCIDFMDNAGIVKDGMSFQFGAGGTSLAVTKYLGDLLREQNIRASFAIGGVTKILVDMFKEGLIKKLFYGQCFDDHAVKFFAERPPNTPVMNVGNYADPEGKSRAVDSLDVVVLGGTEVDTHFNVNVNTHSDGRLLHGIGGHQDTAAASKITVVALPIYRKKNPVVRERVTTITTPGNVVDVIITDVGVAVNPARKDIMERLKGKMKVFSIEELKEMAYAHTGEPSPPSTGKEIVAEIKWIDGSIVDRVYRVVE